MMEMKLNTSRRDLRIIILIFFVVYKHFYSASREEILAVIEPHLIRSSCPHIFSHLSNVFFVRMDILLVWELNFFEVGLIGSIPEQSNRRLLLASLDDWPLCWVPSQPMLVIIEGHEFCMFVVVSFLAVRNPWELSERNEWHLPYHSLEPQFSEHSR